jgi:hypothetical protein
MPNSSAETASDLPVPASTGRLARHSRIGTTTERKLLMQMSQEVNVRLARDDLESLAGLDTDQLSGAALKNAIARDLTLPQRLAFVRAAASRGRCGAFLMPRLNGETFSQLPWLDSLMVAGDQR